jgi:hypothetical protein
MTTMAFETLGTVCVVLHTNDPPSNEEWDKYMAEVKSLIDRFGAERVRTLVFTEGGGPSFLQRKQVNERLRGGTPLTAVVTANAFARGIGRALAVFNPNIKVFRPEAIGDAFRHLAISDAESKAIWRAVARLKGQLGLKGAKGAWG